MKTMNTDVAVTDNNQESQRELSLSQKDTELMLNTSGQINKFHGEEQLYDEVYQKQAAYALNLCSVSISQIVDYNDIYILEQEYEMILNNLNIENMPKDEALLNILKQILDTITFFKIQEGDKKFVQKDYEEKMKAAIWSAVPNIGVIIASGNPLVMITSLASQVGIGYMNYRKEKSKAGMELERAKWQLQRSAIEQFNGLRRELFDTAWRLADKYKFPDNYRLTENQISQYNEILMETHPIRKYERLSAIKERFEAYPTYLYYIGNAANDIYNSKRYDDKIKNRYKELAMKHFEEYLSANKYDLLRENQIASSCALEYIGLLDVHSDRNKIEGLLRYAIKSSGEANDVLELCAMEYLRIGNSEKASVLLKRLVNEGYNTVINSQILSSYYVSCYIKNQSLNIETDYTLLGELVPPEYLFPLPIEVGDIRDLESQFILFQKQILLKKHMEVIKEFADMYTIKFNKVIPLQKNRRYSDYFYSDEQECRTARANEIKIAFNSNEYFEVLKEVDIELSLLEVLNEMYFNIIKLKSISNDEASILKESLKNAYKQQKNQFDKFRDMIDTANNKSYEMILSFTFVSFVEDFFKGVLSTLNSYINKLNHINEFMLAEGFLRSFCISLDIPVPEILYAQNKIEDKSVEINIFDEALGSLKEVKEKKELKEKMTACICENLEKITTNVKFIAPPLKEPISNIRIEEEKFLGYLDDKKIDLYFTTEKLHIVENEKEKYNAFYHDIKYDEKDEILYIDALVNSNANNTRANDMSKKPSKLPNKGNLFGAGAAVARPLLGVGAAVAVPFLGAGVAAGFAAAGVAEVIKSRNEKKDFVFNYKGNSKVNVENLYKLIEKLNKMNPNVKTDSNSYSKDKLNFFIVQGEMSLYNSSPNRNFDVYYDFEEPYD